MRGFSVIALDNPKNDVNVGGTLRAASVYGAQLVVVGGPRPQRRMMRHASDTMKTWRHLPVVLTNDVFDALPYDCVPVAVDLLEEATPLPQFVHPERAFYVFGAEDATLGERILSRCAQKVYVPTNGCMNLAATVNVCLYDRALKRGDFPIGA